METVGIIPDAPRGSDGGAEEDGWAAQMRAGMRVLEKAGPNWRDELDAIMGRFAGMLAKAVAREVGKLGAAAPAPVKPGNALPEARDPVGAVRSLLRRYTLLHDYCVDAVYDQKTMIGDQMDNGAEYYDLMTSLVSKWDAHVRSIETSAGRTLLMLRHVDRALGSYRASCETSSLPSEQRKWRVLSARYLQSPRLSTRQIAEEEHVDERTVRRDLETACNDISVMLFGVDGIDA